MVPLISAHNTLVFRGTQLRIPVLIRGNISVSFEVGDKRGSDWTLLDQISERYVHFKYVKLEDKPIVDGNIQNTHGYGCLRLVTVLSKTTKILIL